MVGITIDRIEVGDRAEVMRVATDGVPDEHILIVEQFRDEMDSVRVVIHAPFSGRVNAPWGMALANRVREWLADQGAGQAGGAGAPMSGADRGHGIGWVQGAVITEGSGHIDPEIFRDHGIGIP